MYEKLISAYVTNLGKYNEGELVGKWLDFPTTQKEINKVLHEIGIDGIRYEEIFITDYEAYGRDVRLEEGGIYTHNGYYVYMIASPRIQSGEVWGAIQEMKEDMKRIA